MANNLFIIAADWKGNKYATVNPNATVQDYIDYYEAIPDSKWTVETFNDGFGKCCAIGHLRQDVKKIGPVNEFTKHHEYISFLINQQLGSPMSFINDGRDGNYRQKTPKARILVALHNLKDKAGE